MKPICANCNLFFRPKKTGVYFEEGMPAPGARALGDGQYDRWASYKLWVGDLWECRACQAQIIVGVSPAGPISEHYKPDYHALRERLGVTRRIDDC